MKVVLDVNILVSALLRDSTTRWILTHAPFEFFIPEPSFASIRKHQAALLEKSGFTPKDFDWALAKILENVQLLPASFVKERWQEAKGIMEKIDEEDVVFIAAALSIPHAVIWSEDKHFEQQKRVSVLKTREILAKLAGGK